VPAIDVEAFAELRIPIDGMEELLALAYVEWIQSESREILPAITLQRSSLANKSARQK